MRSVATPAMYKLERQNSNIRALNCESGECIVCTSPNVEARRLSNVLLKVHPGEPEGLIIQPVEEPSKTLTLPRVFKLICGCVARGVPVYMSVTNNQTLCKSLVQLNLPLASAVKSFNFPAAELALLQTLEKAYLAGRLPIEPSTMPA
jgi:hypothetical protein